MPRNRKDYERGSRISVYLNQQVEDDLIQYINQQSDIQAFFLYAAMELYNNYGSGDISQKLPRNFHFTLGETELDNNESQEMQKPLVNITNKKESVEGNSPSSQQNTSKSNDKNEDNWHKLKDLDDDDYA
ncbi:hypothetical protein GLW08_20520 [Pontibacillus yanchengensis]|uniref:Uncharacterized protein n=2 Tax=Pontibacillus yanchengensis TaxID=462910 RepID=A0A6I5A5A8_9BACI|nr:hypothetical protein [Pontibacillus yanchengensis]MYL35490.1 hypothetical protein [Pontibacillus yanchengensis]MYL55690.1 hypothetical protein [Pontibacillus yanchengensis]